MISPESVQVEIDGAHWFQPVVVNRAAREEWLNVSAPVFPETHLGCVWIQIKHLVESFKNPLKYFRDSPGRDVQSYSHDRLSNAPVINAFLISQRSSIAGPPSLPNTRPRFIQMILEQSANELEKARRELAVWKKLAQAAIRTVESLTSVWMWSIESPIVPNRSKICCPVNVMVYFRSRILFLAILHPFFTAPIFRQGRPGPLTPLLRALLPQHRAWHSLR